jgi:hypothetical protein
VFKSKDTSTLVGFGAYLLLIAIGPLLKATGIALTHWSWWQASVLVWAPPVLVLAWVVLMVGWLLVRPNPKVLLDTQNKDIE